MDLDELNQEVLECSRYGEDDDLIAVLDAGADVNYSDESGNTGLHRAAANGNLGCIRILVSKGAVHKPNDSGNFPMHWAAQNGQPETLKFILESFPDCDVLAQNKFGRSTLTEAFQSKNTDVIELCLTHPSSTEERLLNTKNSSDSSKDKSMPSIAEESDAANAVFHDFVFNESRNKIVKIRELPITRADNPFGSDTSPEEDTTGLGIWPASLLASRWVAMSSDVQNLIRGKVFLELGAGCGVPGLSAALYCEPMISYITDINDESLENAIYNVKANSSSSSTAAPISPDQVNPELSDQPKQEDYLLHESPIIHSENSATIVRVLRLNWMDKASYPKEPVDVVLGSDLVYEKRILPPLTFAVSSLLVSGGTFLYVAPDENRDGMNGLIEELAKVGVNLEWQIPCPDEYFDNPLTGENKDDRYVLHFYDLPAKKKFSLYRFVKS